MGRWSVISSVFFFCFSSSSSTWGGRFLLLGSTNKRWTPTAPRQRGWCRGGFRGISDGLLAQTGLVCFLVKSHSESHVGSSATWEWPSRTLSLPPGGPAVRNAVLGLQSSPFYDHWLMCNIFVAIRNQLLMNYCLFFLVILIIYVM